MTSTTDTRRLAVEAALDIEIKAFRAGSSIARGFWLAGSLDDTDFKMHRYYNENLDGLDIEVIDPSTLNYTTVMGEYVTDKTAANRLLPDRLRDPAILDAVVYMITQAAIEIDGRVDNFIDEITDSCIEDAIIAYEKAGDSA